MIKKIVVFLVYVFFVIKTVFAADCSFLGFEKNRVDSRLEFKCHEDTSLKDNRLIFYVVGKNIKIKTIKTSEGKVDFDVKDISENIKQVSVNISIEIRSKDFDYTVDKDKPVELTIISKQGGNRDFKMLWGGVIKNSHSSKKSKSNNFQFYRDKDNHFYIVEKGLSCSIKDDCDDDIKILDNSCNSQKCKLLKQKLGIYSDFGIIHQRSI